MECCQNCSGEDDVVSFYQGDTRVVLCAPCRYKLLGGVPRNTGARTPGRPALGITKKVSLTMPEDSWEYFDALSEKIVGGRSAQLRRLIDQERSPESRWSNNAALGYAILGAQKLGYSEEQTKKLIRAIYSEFDFKSVDEAKRVYNDSPY